MGTPHVVYIEDLGGTIYVKEKHGPDLSNMLQATYNVTSGNPTQLYNIDPSEISKMYIDGEEVSPTAQYTFSTDGDHTVHYSFVDPINIPRMAFMECPLTSVTIPNSVTSIGNDAFSYCSSLTSVTIGNSVTSIDDLAFSGCYHLEKIELNCKNIGGWFSHIESIKEIIIGNSVTSIERGAFYDCYGLTSVTIGNSVTSIGEQAFYNCSGLTSVTIPNSVTSIENNAFYGCSGLSSVTIGNSVTSIGNSAFEYCSNLSNITSLAYPAPSLGTDVFSDVAYGGILYVSPDATGYDAWLSNMPYGWAIEYSDEL
jgi:hypothetical protein